MSLPLPASDEPIRLAHCIGSLRLGGAESQLTELICALAAGQHGGRRFEQCVILLHAFSEDDPAQATLAARVRAAGCPIFSLGWTGAEGLPRPLIWARLAPVALRMRRCLRRFRPHLLHAQLNWANILAAAVGPAAGVPVVLTSRLELSHYLARRRLVRRLERWALRRSNGIFINSKAVAADLLQHDGIGPDRTRLIYNGVADRFFERPDPQRIGSLRRELGLAPDSPIILTVANLHPYKGHADLLAAVAALPPEIAPHCLLAGRDAGELETLRAQAAQSGIAARVHFLGPRTDIPELLHLAEIFIHPSHEEGFSNAILEGMAAGRAVIATDVGGAREAIEHGASGIIVPPRDPAALAEAIAALLRDPLLRSAIGAAARRAAAERFAIPAMAARFAAWYEESLDRAREHR